MTDDQNYTARIESYANYLPGYPTAYIDYLTQRGKLRDDSIIADIGAGAGILAKAIAPRVNRVLAVELDEKMRLAGVENCRSVPNITVIPGSAEGTGLESSSIDLLTAGQSFHYFDTEASKLEFRRILKPGGLTALSWHIRVRDYLFGEAFENLMRQFCPDYRGASVNEWPTGQFFKNGEYERRTFANHRLVDLETLIGYALSMPFSPTKGEARFSEFVEKLATLYDKYSDHGKLELRAAVDSYCGEI
ncbi:MAG: class I SAM-dependent methyltransferase [Dehalogenimonas sp.]